MTEYTKPLVWKWEDENDNQSGNRPTAGSRFEHKLPKGDKPSKFIPWEHLTVLKLLLCWRS